MALSSSEKQENASNACNTSSRLDLPSDIDSNSQRLYSRRVSAPKFATGSLKSKFGCFEKQHSHPPMNAHSDDRQCAFMNEFHKFNASAEASGTSFESSAKAIADNSCFRVYKMASDGEFIAFALIFGFQLSVLCVYKQIILHDPYVSFSNVKIAKNYELPKLLIREGSPIESFHSSDTQLETLAMRCDSPKSSVNTLASLDSASAAGPINLCDPRNMSKDDGPLNTLFLESLSECSTSNSKRHGFRKPDLTQLRQMFHGPTMRNFNSDATNVTKYLDTVPLKYRRGFSNLNDACTSSADTSNSNVKKRSHSAKEVSFGSDTFEYTHRSVFQEDLFKSFMAQEWPNNDPDEQVRKMTKFGNSTTTKVSSASMNYGTNSNDTNYRSHGQSDGGGASQAQHWRLPGRSLNDDLHEKEEAENSDEDSDGDDNDDDSDGDHDGDDDADEDGDDDDDAGE